VSPFRSQYKITQLFGANPDYYKQFGLTAHEGIDLIPTTGDWEVLALEDGVIVKDEDNRGSGAYGNFVTIWHPSINKATQYCHLDRNYVNNGQQVTKGQPIGYMDSTGNSSGHHLHLNLFEVDNNGVRQNRNNGFLGGTDPLTLLKEITGDKVELDKETFEELVRKSTNHDTIVDSRGIDKNDANSAEKVLDQFENHQSQLEEARRSITQKEAEAEVFRVERDQAVSNVCPDPSAHNTGTGGDTGNDLQQPSDSNNQSDTDGIGTSLPTPQETKTGWLSSLVNFLKKLFNSS